MGLRSSRAVACLALLAAAGAPALAQMQVPPFPQPSPQGPPQAGPTDPSAGYPAPPGMPQQQGGYGQPGYPQPGYPQAGGGYGQPGGFQQPGFPQQPGFAQPGGYPQPGGYQQPGYAGGLPGGPAPAMPAPGMPGSPGGGFPQPGGFPGAPGMPQQPGGSQVAGLPPGVNAQVLQQLSAQEKQDYGVAPIGQLHQGAPHGPTPTSIPGARVIDTLNLVALASVQPPAPMIVLDALGGPNKLPGALPASFAAQPGSFGDGAQQQLARMLQQAANGNPSIPVIVYCSDPYCWMSYNVALRAANAGFRNVFWYRGGLWAWQQAGLPVQPQR